MSEKSQAADTPPPPISFRTLVEQEDEQLRKAKAGDGAPSPPELDTVVSTPGAADEPWLAFTNRDRVGLALSGGGIRSATFNLGLLQALDRKGVLEHVDYLSTVSGGGYIGGFWTAWQLRSEERETRKNADGREEPVHLVFPKQTSAETADEKKPGLGDIRERKEFRHLREFSRFLMPRLSPDSVDLWNAIVTILGGLVPSLLFTAVLLTGGWALWLALVQITSGQTGLAVPGWGWFAAHGRPLTASLVLFLLVLILQWGSEHWWRKEGAAEQVELEKNDCFYLGFAWAFVAAGLLFSLLACNPMGHPAAAPPAVRPPAAVPNQIVVGLSVTVLPPAPAADATPAAPSSAVVRHPGLALKRAWFYAPLALVIAGLIGLIVRILYARFLDPESSDDLHRAQAFDRSIARCLAPATLWTLILLLWWAATEGLDRIGGATAPTTVGGLAAAAFTLLRKWLGAGEKSPGTGTVLDRLKPLLPKIAANVAVAAAVILVAWILSRLLPSTASAPLYRNLLWCFLGSLFVAFLFLCLLHPSRIGMHEFYRSRISRCFLGAANRDSLDAGNTQARRDRKDNFNRQSQERANDDFTLGELRRHIETPLEGKDRCFRARLAPIHLVCCAANNLSGDHLATLYRGARSAVVSARGVSLGNDTLPLDALNFSAALTASAAAFNSNMGFISMHFGGAVAFLTTALNLRLGLWVPHPRSGGSLQRKLPGTFFLAEMFGYTRADRSARVKKHSGWLHLSDGNHFENFGLYELVRRHCRYVILSDCGADPASTFDDFARTARRLREDFGVEIEIDLEVLKPGPDGLARQHLAVGTIHYDGSTGADKGILLYFKPVLTGDEPTDVTQYKVTNGDFPQQTTVDQFYDEPQWESYRRLGEHAGHSAFRYLETPRTANPSKVDNIFHKAASQWQAGWREPGEELRALAERVAAFEADFRREAPAWLRAEFLPECGIPAEASPTPGERNAAVLHLLALVQVMEDVWRLARLDMLWAHPLNEGWMAWLHRWAAMPSFREWWPVLKATGSYGFGKFVWLRLDVGYNKKDDLPGRGQGSSHPATPNRAGLHFRPFDPVADADCLAVRRWRSRHGTPPETTAQTPDSQRLAFLYELLPCSSSAASLAPISLGLALVDKIRLQEEIRYEWKDRDLFIPFELDGGGFIARFLDALLAELRPAKDDVEIRVFLTEETVDKPAMAFTDPGSRRRRVQLVEFYKSRGFVLQRPVGDGNPAELRRRLSAAAPASPA